ncbi:hypothetical protein KUTeg_012798 [Tegillarca granosa]|uniref:Transient receptor potential cation channel subfamily M member 2 n=1 Tax=Tegillarca granosa TaxID=220873 RepID=A0ABQ9EWU2_TEGGR|nr:hypothetical protein KUTeg_012798 [Tegillarca granosa]
MATHTRSHYRPRTSGIQKKKQGHNIEHEIRWIQKHIKVQKCRRFVRNPQYPLPDINEDSDPECYCGLHLSEHTINLTDHPMTASVSNWNYQQDTVSIKNNSFGEIEFTGFGEQCRKFIRVGVDTPMENILKLTLDIWGLEKPNLLISVTGGARDFFIKSHIKGLFRRGLMKVARSTGAWIITGGTNLGVMRYVGEAVRDYKLTYGESSPIVALGIATWGIVQSKESLINEDCRGKWPATYRIEKKYIPNESYLDPNHTHFILVDDGTVHQFGKEIVFRALFENAVSNIKTNTGKNAVSIPVVLLVLQGGPNTLKTVKQAIYNEIPVVVIEETGKAADIIAYAFHNSGEMEMDAKDQHGKDEKKTQVTFSAEVERQIYEMVGEDFGSGDLDSNVRNVKECVMKKNLITVLKLGSSASQDIDIAVLKALLKANKDQALDQLKLALAWNRIDIVKNELFTGDRMWKPGELNEIMFTALLTNKVDFVDILLDHGVSLREFLTKKRLLLLYNQINPNSLLFSLLKKEKTERESKSKYISFVDVGNLIHDLIGDFYTPRYLRIKSYSNFDVDALLDEEQPEQDTMSTKISQDFQNPHQEAFLWSVLLNRQNMAKLFWKYSRDSIAAALVASALLHAMSSKTEDKDLRQSLKKNSAEFSSIAMGVLTECNNIDEIQAQNLLVRELVNWGNTTCLMIAIESDNKHFISHSACQALLNNVWNGQLEDDNYKNKGFEGKSTYSIFEKLYYFYTAPVVTFTQNVIAYIVFLALYSYELLTQFKPDVSVTEIVLIVWVFSIFIEELRQVSVGLQDIYRGT